MPEKFDFSKIEDQKKFENLPEKDREEVVGEAREEAVKMQTDIKEITLTPEQKKANEKMIRWLAMGDVNDAIKIKDGFNLPEQEVQQAAKEAVINSLTRGNFGVAIDIKENFSLPKESIASDEMQQAAKEGVVKLLSDDGDIDHIILVADEFFLSEEIIQQIAKEGFTNLFGNETVDDIIRTIKDFNKKFTPLSKELFQQIFESGFIRCLNNGKAISAMEIQEKFDFSDQFISSQEVLQAAKQGFIKILSEVSDYPDEYENAMYIKTSFPFVVTVQEIADGVHNLQKLLAKLHSSFPNFYEQAIKSVDDIIVLVKYQDNPDQFIQEIQENPFLIDAVLGNPRFSSKLLIKYPEFDELSKENIQTLFEVKKEILENNPDIEPESLEFRQLMQERLKECGNNSEILEAIEKSGINVEEWLNYGETKYFNLESGDSRLAFSETISTPINRIKETIDSYTHTLKNVLKEYKTELTEFKIPLEDTKEIEEKITQMQNELEKAKAEGNEKKAQGIEKGIESLKKKIENIKTVGLWDKLLGDISAFQQLKNDVFGAQENLVKAENDLQEKISGKMPSGRMIQDIKEKISKSKEELRSKFGVLETRIENFKTALPELIAPCLGKERSEALIQEIEQNLAEQFDHYNTDRNTLANLFSERGDEKKSKLENQPMSIFVWARNPDIDLYQGNYTNCCIRIDSEHMGAESTIADYNTDLGVQIVNIWDETKNEPAVAAWCWLGENENNEVVLVVDNIESNTLYSANYPEQLTKELFDYLEEYAESIGAKKIVMGKANNDLPTAGELAKLKDDTQKYEKIGGYNRADGYFLEAENKSVKIVWEAKEVEAVKKVGKKEKEIIKVQFENLNINRLSENDFAKLKQLERKIYQGTDLILGQAMIEDIKQGNGFEYSIIVDGQKSAGANKEAIGYLAAVEDETEEGDPCVYLEDIAVIPEAQGQEIGWRMLQDLIGKLKEKARKENKSVLLDMHLREGSQRFMEKYGQQLEQIGVKLLEEALVPDYYDEGEDALYKVYEVRVE